MNIIWRRIRNLLIVCCLLWLFFAVIGPFFEARIPAWHRYNQIQEEQNLDSGALYYSNVPQTQEAEERMRNAVKEAMQERRLNKSSLN